MENENFKRRGLLKGGLTVLAGTVLASTVARADDDNKVDPASVMYQATPNNGQQCSSCVNFVAPNACKVVSGVVAPTGYCVAYAPKT